MFFCLAEWVYLTRFNDRDVLLDLQKDEYIMLEQEYAVVLEFLLHHEFIKDSAGKYAPVSTALLPTELEMVTAELLDAEIIYISDIPHRSRVHAKQRDQPLTGAAIVDWQIPRWTLEQTARTKDIISALLMLTKFQFILKFRGMFYMIKRLQKLARRTEQTQFTEDLEQLKRLVVALNKTCLYFPKQVKCLEWSYCLVSMAIRRKIKCNLVIGLQLPPFIAHAWVELNDEVIADSTTLPNELAIVLSEPFKKS